jgi:aryl-alcohol dehydrogenase-like predicted oxidoreductase
MRDHVVVVVATRSSRHAHAAWHPVCIHTEHLRRFTPPGSTTDTYNAVSLFLKNGGRALHTAWMYCNQKAIGQAITDSGIPRSELFVMGMLPQWHMGYNETYSSLNDTLHQLQVDYLDLCVNVESLLSDHSLAGSRRQARDMPVDCCSK